MSTRQEVKFYYAVFCSLMPNGQTSKQYFMLAYVCTTFVICFLAQLMSLHGEMLQKERTAVYHQFCKATTGNILLCTVSIVHKYA